MALKAPQGNVQNFVQQENIKAGSYPARVVQIIDFGLQPQKPYQGKDKAPAYELGVTYELVDEFMKDEAGKELEDKPRWVSENFPFHSLNADRAKSTLRYNAFDPDHVHEGDWAPILGQPCNVTIVNNKVGDKVYDNVGAVSAMRPRDAEKCPELKNPAKMFDLDNPDKDVFDKFPKWIQDKLRANLNFKGSKLEALVGNAPAKQEEKKPEPAKQEEAEDSMPY